MKKSISGMELIIILVILMMTGACIGIFFTGKSFTFKVGQCIIHKWDEKWSTNAILKIQEIGKRNYHVLEWRSYKQWGESNDLSFERQSYFEQIECPN